MSHSARCVVRAPAQMPLHYYFCREVATNSARSTIRPYALQSRRYLGPTSMDTEMAFIMCNQAQACAMQQQAQHMHIFCEGCQRSIDPALRLKLV